MSSLLSPGTRDVYMPRVPRSFGKERNAYALPGDYIADAA